MNSKELCKLLEQDGWVLDRVKGSHHMFKHPTRPGIVVVPHPRKDVPIGTLRSILKAAGLPTKPE
jgi:predicted RNA binding protein YcfA (HicA-like mRNA interferase family)